jgi:hypothetical protein
MNQDIIYYNLSLTCKKVNQTDPDVKAYFQEGRSEVLVSDAQKYNFSITRFTLNSNNLPILIPKIQIGQGDINKTTYGMQFLYSGDGVVNSDSYYLEYDCRNKYFNNSVSLPTYQQADDPYYYLINIQHFVDMFNDCLSQCFDNIKGKQNTITGTAPQLIYNNNNTFSIYFNNTDFTTANSLNLCLNDDLYNLFRNFNYKVINNNGFNNMIFITNKLTNLQTVNGNDYLVESQFYPSMENWTPVQSIVFQTNVLGIYPENVSSPAFLSSSNTIFSQNANATDDILTDIILPIDNPEDYNSFIMYNANVYREANIKQDTIRKIDMYVSWRNKFNSNLYPIMLSDGDTITCKIKFERYK